MLIPGGISSSPRPFQSSRIDPPQLALVTFRSGVPELSVDPSDTGHKTVGLDGAKDRSRVGIDLMDLPVAILPDPERPFGPRKPRVTAAARRRDGGKHTAALRIDFLDAILGDLKQVLAVEGCSGMRSDIDRAHCLPACRIEGIQLISGCKPDVLTIIGDSMHAGRRPERGHTHGRFRLLIVSYIHLNQLAAELGVTKSS